MDTMVKYENRRINPSNQLKSLILYNISLYGKKDQPPWTAPPVAPRLWTLPKLRRRATLRQEMTVQDWNGRVGIQKDACPMEHGDLAIQK